MDFRNAEGCPGGEVGWPQASCGLSAFEQVGDRHLQLRQFQLNDSPDDFKIHAEVVVDHLVSHPGDLLPGNLRSARLRRLGEILDRLPDHFELAKCRVLAHAVTEETVAIAAAVRRDVVQCVPDVLQIDPGRPSQRCGFSENALLEVGTESSIRQHLHRASEEILEVLLKGDHVEERPATLDLDEDVDIAIGSSVSTNR